MDQSNTLFAQKKFNIKNFTEEFNTNIIDATSEVCWPGHFVKIKELTLYAQNLLRLSSNIDPKDRKLLSCLLAHAAWAVYFKQRAEGLIYANTLVKLSIMLASDNLMLLGYAQYVQSTIYRGNNEFDNALCSAVESITAFESIKNYEPTTLAHAYNQACLAALRLKKYFLAITYGKKAQKLLGSTSSNISFVGKLLVDAEGDVSARTYMNLTQCHISNAAFALALDALEQMENCAPPQTSKDNAYRSIIKGECYFGLKQITQALAYFNIAHQIYSSENDKKTNYLRCLLGMTAAYLELVNMDDADAQEKAYNYYQEATQVHGDLQLQPAHDFSKQLIKLRNVVTPPEFSHQKRYNP